MLFQTNEQNMTLLLLQVGGGGAPLTFVAKQLSPGFFLLKLEAREHEKGSIDQDLRPTFCRQHCVN